MKLQLQYFGHLLQIVYSLENTLMLGKIEGRGEGMTEDEIFGWHNQSNRQEFVQTPGDSEGHGILPAAVDSIAKCRKWLGNWTTTDDEVITHLEFSHMYRKHVHITEEFFGKGEILETYFNSS